MTEDEMTFQTIKPLFTAEEERRREALQAAMQLRAPEDTAEEIIADAKAFEAYLKG